ncbi:hypothetical protein KAI65_02660 [Candidatus Parcubacteria bacterium]|nr:hypothetical protein [Candidatus Parcubacteria bacterium]
MKNKILYVLCCALFVTGASCFALNSALGDEPVYEEIYIVVHPDEINLNVINQDNETRKNEVTDRGLSVHIRQQECGYIVDSYDIGVYVNDVYVEDLAGLRNLISTYEYCSLDGAFEKFPIVQYAIDNDITGEATITLKGTFVLRKYPDYDKDDYITKTFIGTDTVYFK